MRGASVRTRQSKTFLREERICFASTDFLKMAGFGFPPRRRVREECAADFVGQRLEKFLSSRIINLTTT